MGGAGGHILCPTQMAVFLRSELSLLQRELNFKTPAAYIGQNGFGF